LAITRSQRLENLSKANQVNGPWMAGFGEVMNSLRTTEQRAEIASVASLSRTPEQQNAAWSGVKPMTPAQEKWDLKEYGLQPGEYGQMFEVQNGRCAICGRPPAKMRLNVDHCHRCGRYKKWLRASVRGLLCPNC